MDNKNIHLLISSIAVITALVVIDVVVGKVGDYAMTRLPDYSGLFAKDNFRLNRVKTDVVIIGSSRGSHHYVSTMLKDSINNYTGGGYTLYNAAIDGKFINSNSCAAESIIKRYSPKLLIFEVSEAELKRSDNTDSDVNFSLPHYTTNYFVKKYADEIGWEQQAKCISSLFRYNGKLLRIFSSLIFRSDSTTGYEPLYKEMTVIPESQPERLSEIDSYSLDNFSRVLKTAKEKGIRLIIVTSPRFRPNSKNDFLANLCADYDTPYIELYDLTLFNSHPEYFQDASHLNDKGAHIYTAMFFDSLKPYLNDLIIE